MRHRGEGGSRQSPASMSDFIPTKTPLIRLLKHSLVSKAEIATRANNNMIQNADTQEAPTFNQPLCDLDILAAWFRFSAWVVMNKKYSGGGFFDRGTEHFTGMYKRSGEGSLGDTEDPDDTIFSVQESSPETFFPYTFEPWPKVGVDFKASSEGTTWGKQSYAGTARKLQGSQHAERLPVV